MHPLVVVGLRVIFCRAEMALVTLKRAVLKKRCDGIPDAGRVALARYHVLGCQTNGVLGGTPLVGELFEILHAKKVRVALVHAEKLSGGLDVGSITVVVVIDLDTLETGHGRDGFQRGHRRLEAGGTALGGIEDGTAILHEVERRSLSTLNFDNCGDAIRVIAGCKQTDAEVNIVQGSALGLALNVVVFGLDRSLKETCCDAFCDNGSSGIDSARGALQGEARGEWLELLYQPLASSSGGNIKLLLAEVWR